ncbi:integrase [Buttiauxella sp. B2]|uniref:tyrosine-type recombinase/integrase n=1 Tax=Buttiauxella sp. B2 TaxID=2587812 RepID=UPI00112428CE|nr:tyrosine-type recombinase/integrase [Buttiauxella sp. B2]TNV22495.1 integrase [Buttiauxella sp. B2]
MITDVLLKMAERRGKDRALSQDSITRECHAINSTRPVLCLGVRAASHPDYWKRHAENRITEGRAATTVRAELNYTAAVLEWTVRGDIDLKVMTPASAMAISEAIRQTAQQVSKRVKRYPSLAKPARVSIDEFSETARQIEGLRSPHKEICAMALCFGLRATEAVKLRQSSLLDSGMLFIPDRTTKTRANLLLPIPVKYIKQIKGWLDNIEMGAATYSATYMYINRKGFKWCLHDMRKMFRTKAAVRGEDYLASELILNHEIKDVPNVYLQKPPYKRMRDALLHALNDYRNAQQ